MFTKPQRPTGRASKAVRRLDSESEASGPIALVQPRNAQAALAAAHSSSRNVDLHSPDLKLNRLVLTAEGSPQCVNAGSAFVASMNSGVFPFNVL